MEVLRIPRSQEADSTGKPVKEKRNRDKPGKWVFPEGPQQRFQVKSIYTKRRRESPITNDQVFTREPWFGLLVCLGCLFCPKDKAVIQSEREPENGLYNKYQGLHSRQKGITSRNVSPTKRGKYITVFFFQRHLAYSASCVCEQGPAGALYTDRVHRRHLPRTHKRATHQCNEPARFQRNPKDQLSKLTIIFFIHKYEQTTQDR